MLKLRAVLARSLSSGDLATISTSFDVVGDIAVLRQLSKNNVSKLVAAEIMKIHKNVRVVLLQEGKISGALRLRNLSRIAGEDRKATRHRENGCIFSVDLEKCYFSTRLSHERLRIAKLVTPGETVVNMFAGIGCFSILIAKYAKPDIVFSIDINPEAVALMRENVRLNDVYGKIVPLLGDSACVVRRHLRGVADRVLMPLPEKALDYLPEALLSLKPCGGCVHIYDFQHATKDENPLEKTTTVVAEKMAKIPSEFEFRYSRIVRSIGPNWYQTVVDLRVPPVAGKS